MAFSNRKVKFSIGALLVIGGVMLLNYSVFLPGAARRDLMIFGSLKSLQDKIQSLDRDKMDTSITTMSAKRVFKKRNINSLCGGNYQKLLDENIKANAKRHYTRGSPPLHNFKFIINNEQLCSNVTDLLYFMYVFSIPQHFEERKGIRAKWANRTAVIGSSARVAFVIGLANNGEIQKLIQAESKKYGDIIQINVVDSYQNLTIKGTMSNLWATLYCNNAQFIVKADEDTLVNNFKLTVYLKKEAKGYTKSLFCWVQNGEVVQRGGKFRVEFEQLAAFRYPRFCHGPLWIATPDLPEELFCASFKVPYIPCEDVYTSGLLVDYLGKIKHISAPGIDTWPWNVQKKFF